MGIHRSLGEGSKGKLSWDARNASVSADVIRTLDKAGVDVQVNTALYTGLLGLGEGIAAPLVCVLCVCVCMCVHVCVGGRVG